MRVKIGDQEYHDGDDCYIILSKKRDVSIWWDFTEIGKELSNQNIINNDNLTTHGRHILDKTLGTNNWLYVLSSSTTKIYFKNIEMKSLFVLHFL